ncbi:MAG TPA: sugar ABC transporter substrate-binding protein [Solirubrobacteraceae bacterium]|nr:sugar ABC transporter substrate-binding protein [Solirubrobacteraceae bacterium]
MKERSGAAAHAFDRREFLRVTGAGVAGLGLLGFAGCGGDDGGGGGGGGGGNEPVTLRWSMWSGSPEETQVWQDLADDVKAKYPNITVKLETTTFQTYWDKLQTQVASNTQADIIGMQAQRMPGFAARGALAPLQEQIDRNPSVNYQDFFPVIQDALSFEGQPHALAYDLGPPLLYYNRDLFKAARIPVPSSTEPMSWEEFRELAQRLTDAGSRQYGYAQDWGFDWIIPWIWSNGGDYMNEDASASTLDAPEAMEGMQFLSDLYRDEIAAPVTDFADPTAGLNRFLSGRVAMHPNGPWQIVNLRANAKFNFDVAPIPAGSAGSIAWAAGSGFGVSSATDNADAAFNAISVITGEEALKSLTAAGRGYPARQSAVPIFEEERPPAHAAIVEEVLNSEIARTETRPFRSTATWQETDVMLTQDLIPSVFLGDPSIEEAVRNVKPKFDALLTRAKDIESRG